MAINQILPFALAQGANVLTPEEYSALASRTAGFGSGVARSKDVNTPVRQASFVASALGQYISDRSGQDVLDDGDVTGLVEKLTAALAASPAFTGTPTAPTPAVEDSSERLATTSFVSSALAPLGNEADEDHLGIVRLATGVLAQALNDDRTALTPRKLADAFGGPNLGEAAQGYLRLPNGLVLQWGTSLESHPAISSTTVTFPRAYASSLVCLLIAEEYKDGTNANDLGTVFVSRKSLTDFSWVNAGGMATGHTVQINYFALGR
ncbi:hypothetical protein CEG14_15520 [Bordetella genomosp. 1]|uniref:Putative tail fiber protein gp53-like C-terminal domain-containing protein n=1 Tax=Bordetella genomosp. 1 TaxID=1395607 RepID=A0A261SG98_9BORD|nr:hypothetical protein [Bordetella genomosp. 1]OZI36406.1 hypothetical protein CEG14_15520 [Bordetella genomosp. 1]